ncbi:RILP-like protein 1 isoform X2 [Thamnophis elegans]|uniref:RILP-like protein 1 isoform X2 n=1 Tax=Thamnophis elegans TaxID=35005 RepID=UPI001377ECD6|nr:RILP-like protein 1 isoform X2 [Thamnophis elegans]
MKEPRPRSAGPMEGVGGSGVSALEKSVADLTVMDVYDIASLVGQEFERLIDQHGCEAIGRLMPKVVRVLEILEVLVSRDHISPEVEELRLELDRLRLERVDRLEKERKHQKELELVEDVWRGEAQDLLTQIAQLQEENKQLMTNLTNKDVNFSEEEFQKHEGMSERERQVMKKLKEVVDKQRDEIRAKDRELGLKNEDVEALQQQQNRLMKINHDLRHRITVVEAQGKGLIEQKVELEAYLQTKEQEMTALRAELGKMREKLQGEPSHNGEAAQPEEPKNAEEFLSEAEKTALDLKDPNRPRFTLQELRDVLHERNELKSKVFLLQEELLYYKSDELDEETRSAQPPAILNSKPLTPQESGIKRLIFTAVMPMVAAGLIPDDPTLQPIRRLMSLVGTLDFECFCFYIPFPRLRYIVRMSPPRVFLHALLSFNSPPPLTPAVFLLADCGIIEKPQPPNEKNGGAKNTPGVPGVALVGIFLIALLSRLQQLRCWRQ